MIDETVSRHSIRLAWAIAAAALLTGCPKGECVAWGPTQEVRSCLFADRLGRCESWFVSEDRPCIEYAEPEEERKQIGRAHV